MSLADRVAEGASGTAPTYTLILHKKDAFLC